MLSREWDVNQDGKVSLIEWRQNVRRLLNRKQELDMKQVDSMFRGLDTDRSGDLGIGEVQAALKKLQAEADGTASQRDQEQVGGLRARVVALRQVLEMTVAAETEAEKLREAEKPSLSLQIGTCLHQRGVKVSELVRDWGGSDGSIDRAEWRKEVRALGGGHMVADNQELDAIFESIDKDGGGTLDIPEVKQALKRFADESEQQKAAVKLARQQWSELARIAREGQAAWKAEVIKQAEEEAAAVAKETHETQVRASEAAAARAAKAEAAAEKKAAAAAAKAASDANIKARQQGAKGR